MKSISNKMLCLSISTLSVCAILTSCGNQNKAEENNSLTSTHLETCHQTVTVTPKAYGLIVLNWNQYAPNTNMYVTVTVVPHALGSETKTITQNSNTGELTLEGFTTGSYTVYYILQPGSGAYAACTGAQAEIKFF